MSLLLPQLQLCATSAGRRPTSWLEPPAVVDCRRCGRAQRLPWLRSSLSALCDARVLRRAAPE